MESSRIAGSSRYGIKQEAFAQYSRMGVLGADPLDCCCWHCHSAGEGIGQAPFGWGWHPHFSHPAEDKTCVRASIMEDRSIDGSEDTARIPLFDTAVFLSNFLPVYYQQC